MPDNENRGRLSWLWKLANIHHRHPPPQLASKQPVGPQFTLGGTSQPIKQVTERQVPAPAKATVPEKLKQEAELRRKLLRDEERLSRESQHRRHAKEAEQQREKLDREGVIGIQRLAAEGPLADQHRDEQQQLDAHFSSAWATLDADTITAFEVGYFSDALAVAFNRAAAREAGRDVSDGGRERE